MDMTHSDKERALNLGSLGVTQARELEAGLHYLIFEGALTLRIIQLFWDLAKFGWPVGLPV